MHLKQQLNWEFKLLIKLYFVYQHRSKSKHTIAHTLKREARPIPSCSIKTDSRIEKGWLPDSHDFCCLIQFSLEEHNTDSTQRGYVCVFMHMCVCEGRECGGKTFVWTRMKVCKCKQKRCKRFLLTPRTSLGTTDNHVAMEPCQHNSCCHFENNSQFKKFKISLKYIF